MPSTAPETPAAPVHVAVAAIRDARGRVLLCRRPDHAHLGGLWEFPGGKIEAGETLEQALAREIREEVGLEVAVHRPLMRVPHRYPDKSVLLDVHLVTGFAGEAHGREGQPVAWVPPCDIHRYALPDADRPIVTALRLPARYLITPELDGDPSPLAAALSAATGGVELVQLRAPSLGADAFRALAKDAVRVCRKAGARLLLNADPALVDAVGADGVHLNGRRLASTGRRPLPADRLVAASCHGAADLRRAEGIGADFAVLSPVLPTASHPGATTLGWEGFAELADAARIPVYALGGMHPGLMDRAWGCGAQGIAGIRGLWPAAG
jgi:8-oxo-dGTP diphosphatase